VGTPQAIINKLNADFTAALKTPEAQKSIQTLGLTASPSTPEEFARQIKADNEAWGKVVKAAGVKAE
jgi:tripartite-type tricarboxylate transporter receptor subunit TctC